jgi:multicomponent K+:H+ antiporter subunit F
MNPTTLLTTLEPKLDTLFAYAVDFALLCFALSMLCATVRLMRGPAAQDRVLALDSLYVSGLLTLLSLGIRSRSTAYFDMALLIALFGFVGTLALSRFLLRGEVIEP